MNKSKVDFSQLPEPILEQHPQWVELYNFAWRLAANSIRELRKRLYVCNAWDPTRNFQWVWDTCFGSLYCRYGAGQFPGINGLDNFYDLQREDGYISMTYDMDTGEEAYPDRINPPLFAWTEWEYYLTTGDASRFERVVPKIERLMDWIDANRRTRAHQRRRMLDRSAQQLERPKDEFQLYYFRDCGSSGMDDSPRTPRLPDAGQFFDWIDLSSQMALAFRCLGKMQAVVGNAAKAEYWEKRARELGGLINDELWCEQTAFYHDRMLPNNFVGCKTAAGFWPILAGICPAERLAALVAHLKDEREFNRPTPVPTLSADDPNYSREGRYWLGGVWAPTNYMITRGLTLAGQGTVAHEITGRYIGALARTYEKNEPHTLWEANSPEEDKPGLSPYCQGYVKPHFVGWSALGPIAMLIENVLGLQINAPRNEVSWDIRLTEGHGIKNLKVGNGRFRCHCAARAHALDKVLVELESTMALTVQLKRGAVAKTITLQPGTVARFSV